MSFSTCSLGWLANNMISDDSCYNKSLELYKWLSHTYVLDGLYSQEIHSLALKHLTFPWLSLESHYDTFSNTENSPSTLDFRPHRPTLLLVSPPLPFTPGCFPNFLSVAVYFIRQERKNSKQIRGPYPLHHHLFPTSHTHFFSIKPSRPTAGTLFLWPLSPPGQGCSLSFLIRGFLGTPE